MSLQVCSVVFICLFSIAYSSQGVVYYHPEQIHLSLGKNPSEMVVTWVTLNSTNISVVHYGQKTLDREQNGTMSRFVDGGKLARVIFIHRVILTNLSPKTKYTYHCGSINGWSALYFFTTMRASTNWSPRFLVYGDMGNSNAISLPHLQEEVQKGMYDAVLHVGDFGYDLNIDNGKVGDEFMRQIEPIAAYLPYMTCVGNHEVAYNYSNYNNRFTMLNKEGNMNNYFYSFDVGPVHITVFSTEFYYFLQYGWLQIARQYKWLENDLRTANLPENRSKRPWLITMAHRPMYCSNTDHDDCTRKESIIRKGFPIIKAFGLEDLFYRYGVDLEIWAHEHSYERLWPVYDKVVYNGSYEFPYVNPKAPVHIITGSAGCQEYIDSFLPNYAIWSAVRISDYGYTRMYVQNNTHLHIEQVSADLGAAVVDSIVLVKEKHGPQAWH